MSEKTQLSTVSVPNVTSTRFSEVFSNSNKYVSYGKNNLYPDYLWRLYTQCPTHQSIIDGKVDYILGNGISGGDKPVNSKGETLMDVVAKIALDQQIFGGFSFQVIYNNAGRVAEIYWSDFSKWRTNKEVTQLFWNDSWQASGAKPIPYAVFDADATKKTSQVFYNRGLTCRSIYPLPSYIAATDALETEIEIQSYHLNGIRNNFSVSAIINMNNGVPEEEARKVQERKIQDKFCGSNAAAKLLISWNDNKDVAMTVDRLEEDNLDKKFQQLSKDTQRNIFISHRVTSPSLFGVLPENTGFSKQEYEESFSVFNRTVIKPQQDEIIRALTRIFPKESISFEPFSL